MVGFRGVKIYSGHEIVRDFDALNIGGTILFDYDMEKGEHGKNIENKDQVKNLTRYLSKLAGTPMFIAVDQEGGSVARLKPEHGYKKAKSFDELGKINNPHLTRSTSRLIASHLRESGINLNLAPVIDLNVNKQNPVIGKLGRSISDQPEKVVRHAGIFIDEHNKKSVATCVKHFMGHGSSAKDTHLGFVDVTEIYDEKEKEPFKRLIKKNVVDMVMTAHLFNRNYDNVYPCTFSKKIIGGILRGEMGYDGVVVSDDLQMKAVTDKYGFEESVLLAINAGVDIVLISNNMKYDGNVHIKAINTIYNAVKNKEITCQCINASFNRIMKVKRKIDLRRSQIAHL